VTSKRTRSMSNNIAGKIVVIAGARGRSIPADRHRPRRQLLDVEVHVKARMTGQPALDGWDLVRAVFAPACQLNSVFRCWPDRTSRVVGRPRFIATIQLRRWIGYLLTN